MKTWFDGLVLGGLGGGVPVGGGLASGLVFLLGSVVDMLCSLVWFVWVC